MKLAAWLGGATYGCIITAIVILLFGIFLGPLQPLYWLGAMLVSAWWHGGKALVRYERQQRYLL